MKPKAYEASVYERAIPLDPGEGFRDLVAGAILGGRTDTNESGVEYSLPEAVLGGGRPLNWQFTKSKSASNEFDPASLVNVTRQSSANTYSPAAFGKK